MSFFTTPLIKTMKKQHPPDTYNICVLLKGVFDNFNTIPN